MKKYRGMEVWRYNERGTAFLCYARDDLGMKYKVFTERDGIKRFFGAYASPVEASAALEKIF